MIISNYAKFIFIKTRKTAGSTLEKLLYPYLSNLDVCTGSERDGVPSLNETTGKGHLHWLDIKQRYPEQFDNYWKFTIERNPWDKVVSSYYWHQKIKEERFGHMDFETYIMNCDLLPTDWLLYGESYKNDTILVDKIYKYEQMEEMYSDLNEKFGFAISKEQIHGTKLKGDIRKERDYRKLHTTKTIDKVSKLFKKEIELLGYTYE
jgi:hypothetical protein